MTEFTAFLIEGYDSKGNIITELLSVTEPKAEELSKTIKEMAGVETALISIIEKP